VYIAKKIEGNRFVIAGGTALEVSWQVTGIRQDAYANDHRIKVEVQKPASEHGRYLYPDSIAKDRRPQSELFDDGNADEAVLGPFHNKRLASVPDRFVVGSGRSRQQR
jgi:hypothetical protein